MSASPERDLRGWVTTGDGVRLWLDGSGSGFPLLLCHGPGLWDNLGSLATLVDHVARVYRWDQRGCGRSDRVGPYTVERMVMDMEAIREHLGVERWVVAGHSWGASLALHYAAAHPRRSAGLIYVSGTGLADSWAAANRAAYRAERERRLTTDQRARLAELVDSADRAADEEREYRLLSWTTDVSPGRSAEELLVEDLEAPWEINVEANRALGEDALCAAADLRVAVSELPVPALLVHGSNDTRPPAGAAELADLLPLSELVTLRTGHNPWLEAPREVADLLVDFVVHRVRI